MSCHDKVGPEKERQLGRLHNLCLRQVIDAVDHDEQVVSKVIRLRRMDRLADAVLHCKMVEAEGLFKELTVCLSGLGNIHPEKSLLRP